MKYDNKSQKISTEVNVKEFQKLFKKPVKALPPHLQERILDIIYLVPTEMRSVKSLQKECHYLSYIPYLMTDGNKQCI